MAQKGLPFYAQQRFFNWIDIGTVTDFWSVLQSVLQGEVAQLEVPGTQIADGLWVGLNTSIDWDGTTIEGPVYIGSGCKIEAGCKIVGPTWIGHGSHLCAGAEVVRSVLFEYTRILDNAHLDEVIVVKEYSVDRAGNMRKLPEGGSDDWGDARDRLPERNSENDSENTASMAMSNL
jgi:mannose-1-phosphate guanylyltransferase